MIPSDFKENFLMNSANKHDLAHYLAEKITDFNSNATEKIQIGAMQKVCHSGEGGGGVGQKDDKV